MNKQLGIQPEIVIVQAVGIIAADLDGEKAIMSVEKGKYFGLDTLGSSIWELISKPVTVKEVIDNLIKEYDVDEATCQKDIGIFLNKMYVEGLISIA